jgi:Protein of unknown function (DUF2924)
MQLRTGLSRRPDAMQKKRRNGRVSTKTCVKDEIAHLRGLDLGGLRARWQSVFQRSAPAHLTRHLLFAIIAYRIQADRFGDLDHETRQLLDQHLRCDRPVAEQSVHAMGPRKTKRGIKISRRGIKSEPARGVKHIEKSLAVPSIDTVRARYTVVAVPI